MFCRKFKQSACHTSSLNHLQCSPNTVVPSFIAISTHYIHVRQNVYQSFTVGENNTQEQENGYHNKKHHYLARHVDQKHGKHERKHQSNCEQSLQQGTRISSLYAISKTINFGTPVYKAPQFILHHQLVMQQLSKT